MSLVPALKRFQKRFPTEAACIEHLTKVRFRNGRYCPYCGSLRTYEYVKSNRYRCSGCKKDFSVLSNTVFENSHLELRQYFLILSMMTDIERGLPLKEIVEAARTTDKSARRAIRLFKTTLESADVNGMTARERKRGINNG